MKETNRDRVTARIGCVAVACLAIVLVWFANIFEIICFASRAFALYHLIQGMIAFAVAGRVLRGAARWRRQTAFGALLVLLVFVVVFGRSAE